MNHVCWQQQQLERRPTSDPKVLHLEEREQQQESRRRRTSGRFRSWLASKAVVRDEAKSAPPLYLVMEARS